MANETYFSKPFTTIINIVSEAMDWLIGPGKFHSQVIEVETSLHKTIKFKARRQSQSLQETED